MAHGDRDRPGEHEQRRLSVPVEQEEILATNSDDAYTSVLANLCAAVPHTYVKEQALHAVGGMSKERSGGSETAKGPRSRKGKQNGGSQWMDCRTKRHFVTRRSTIGHVLDDCCRATQ